VCDREPLMARQLAERFRIDRCFSDVAELLRVIHPDVVHITTPPQSHFDLARPCLEAGSHVYLEKPFTVTSAEAEGVINLARRCGRHVTAGHNYQFTPEMMSMRKLVADGFLGGRPVHIESHWSYDLADMSYVGPLLGDPDHWVRRLPGGLLHNIISHGVARLAEFLDDELDEVVTLAHQSERLKSLGGQELNDELRLMIRDRVGTTASFCFSTQAKPGPNQLRVFGPENSITVDLVSGTVMQQRGRSYKSYLTYVMPPLVAARQHFANARRNLYDILRWRLYQDSGVTELVRRFHRSVTANEAPPISYREILLTARIMDQAFSAMNARRCPATVAEESARALSVAAH